MADPLLSKERTNIETTRRLASLGDSATSRPEATPDSTDITVVEVGPRDGLQNESSPIPTGVKIAFIDALSGAGLPVIEATSFVNPKAVPQLSDAAEVMTGIRRAEGVRYSALVPNMRGLERAVGAGVEAIALFTSATEAFAEANVGVSIDSTFERFQPVVCAAKEQGCWIRGYVSVAFGCPYSGVVAIGGVVSVAERLLTLGCDEICLADTIGVATPESVRVALRAARQSIPLDQLALHFHDTSGMALSNVAVAIDHGVRIFDSAAGGLGGCPFAPGAPGNLSTEDLVEFANEIGLRTGIDLGSIESAVSLLRPHVPRLESVVA